LLRNALIRWFINAVALGIASLLFRGIFFNKLSDLLIASALFGMLNTFIKPLLIILTLPINILSLGLFTFVVNAFMLGLTSVFLSGFVVTGFWSAFGGAIVVSIVSVILNLMFKE
jgi:putative membrane protein